MKKMSSMILGKAILLALIDLVVFTVFMTYPATFWCALCFLRLAFVLLLVA